MPLTTYPYISMNKTILTTKTCEFPISDAGFCYGLGVFESIRLTNRQLPLLDLHLKRLTQDAKTLNITCPLTTEEITTTAYDLIEKNTNSDGVLNLYLTAGTRDISTPGFQFNNPTIYGIIRDYTPNNNPISCECREPEHPRSSLNAIKSMAYLSNILEKQKDPTIEPILTTSEGELLETPTHNLFLIQKDTILTPKNPTILNGIMKQHLLNQGSLYNRPIIEKPCYISDIQTAEGAFLTNAVAGIRPINEIKGLATFSDYRYEEDVRVIMYENHRK